MAEEEYFWFWHGDDGEWRPFDSAIMAQLEDAQRRGEDQVSGVQLGRFSYALQLASLEQVNETTGYARPITRSTALWFWRDDDGQNWNRYNREFSLLLALADLSVRDRSTCLVSGETTYYVDLERRVQQNIGTGHEREIQSGLRDEEPDSDDSGEDGDDNMQDLIQQAPQSYLCPISKRIMKDPVSTLAGSTYERKYIKRYLRRHNDDPATGTVLPNKNISDNRALRDMIDWWKEDLLTQQQRTDASPSETRGASATSMNAANETATQHEQMPAACPTIEFTESFSRSEYTMDTLKVVCLGLSNIESDVAFRNPINANGKLGVNRYNWCLQSTEGGVNIGVHCNVYDFVGQKVHHASQKVFFSPRSLYFIVWDMGASNPDTFQSSTISEMDANVALERDIFERVHFWVDAIQKDAPGSVIMPVVSLDGSFGTNNNIRQNAAVIPLQAEEIERRCILLKRYFEREMGEAPEEVPQVRGSTDSSDGLKALKSVVLQQLSGDSRSFPHTQYVMSPRHRGVRDMITEMLHEGIQVATLNDLIHAGNGRIKNEDQLRSALQWLSDTGEILFHGKSDEQAGLHDSALDLFAVLDPDWIVAALSRVLRPCIHDVIRTVIRRESDVSEEATSDSISYHGPVATDSDLRRLWRPMLSPSSETEQLLDFLQLLFTRCGVLVPLIEKWTVGSNPDAKLMFLPGLLGPGEHGEFVGLYNNTIFSKLMLAQSVQFHNMASPLLLERICAAVLRQVYARARNDTAQQVAEGQIFVKNILCWRTLLYFRLGLYARTSGGDVQASTVDIYAHLVDASSDLCVGAKYLGGTKQSLIISAKGEDGNDAEIIWNGGYDIITDAAKQVLEDSDGVGFERHFFCPSCLAEQNLRDTRAWSEGVLQRALKAGERTLQCENCHNERIQLLLGPSASCYSNEYMPPSTVPPDVRADVLMPGVVMVGLYDEKRSSEKVRRVGSGFVVDSERGLIVTAAHTLMKLWGQEDFGRDNYGIDGAKAVIGVIPAEKNSDGTYPPAVFRYFAKIVRKEANLENGECHVDACILQLTSRFENDVEGNGDLCGEEISISLTGDPLLMKKQDLMELDVMGESRLGEEVRILGFEQPDNTRVNRSFGMSAGSVLKKFETLSVGGERYRYMPRKKIVLNCDTTVGHSGGPCVNQSGQVLGVLSCAGFTESTRSFLVPTSEWIDLVPKKNVLPPKPGAAEKAIFPPKSIS